MLHPLPLTLTLTPTLTLTLTPSQELIHFSNADNVRSIPSVVDGLKPGQRKILFACFKRGKSMMKNEIKVRQPALHMHSRGVAAAEAAAEAAACPYPSPGKLRRGAAAAGRAPLRALHLGARRAARRPGTTPNPDPNPLTP